jgi:hypothetical protein
VLGSQLLDGVEALGAWASLEAVALGGGPRRTAKRTLVEPD